VASALQTSCQSVYKWQRQARKRVGSSGAVKWEIHQRLNGFLKWATDSSRGADFFPQSSFALVSASERICVDFARMIRVLGYWANGDPHRTPSS